MVKFADRVKVSTSTTGTGTITLGSADTGYQTFSEGGIQDGDEVRYVIEHSNGTDWEIGSGVYTHSGTTLSRATVSSSSNSGSKISLSGTSTVFISPSSADLTLSGAAHNFSSFTATAGQTTFTVNYSAGNILVFMNGAKLDSSSFTATNGTSVVLGSGASVGDIVEVVESGGAAAGTFSSTSFTATSGQTAFSGSFNTAKSSVFLNGILLLLTTDYTMTASTVTLTSGATTGDILQVNQYAI